ncbi:MAG TPA: ImmA/IrrE family metallo-endopeptidase [Prosthecobacter sp.]|nr:ImmA/IrrE family metallo-endopeptidase [Prosthecobacter sp.]
MSRAKIRAMATAVRSITGLGAQACFDITRFLEIELPKLDPDFTFLVSERSAMGENLALTHVRERSIEVREDVYDKACEGWGFDRLTLAHELGHYVLHPEVALARRVGTGSIKAYVDPEWQANAFAGELLMPLAVFKRIDPKGAANTFGVTQKAVETQTAAWRREGLL